MKIISVFLSVLTLVACTSVQTTTRVSTSLRAQEYNSVASRYLEQPTFVEMATLNDGTQLLIVDMKLYAVPSFYSGLRASGAAAEALRHSRIGFGKNQVTGYVAAIDKFLEWATLASERKDAFTKEISSVPTGRGALKFTFHSGNDRSHFLAVAWSAMGTTIDEKAQYFDISNAKELKRLLLAFASDSIQRTNIDSIYK
ncbi:MAG: hypothetical protein FJ399_10135 [Verrucomicrobia bacterium]|nr:hypothetical protein [Verrucomicrobiota bacterium]